MTTKMINPEELFNSVQYGFSQVAVVGNGKTVYMSGQVAWDADQQIVGEGDLRAQAWQALRNVAVGMQAAGGLLTDVVSLRIYIVNRVMAENTAVADALRHFFPGDSPPVTTWIGVESLADEAFLIEIEPIGVIEG